VRAELRDHFMSIGGQGRSEDNNFVVPAEMLYELMTVGSVGDAIPLFANRLV
jgi:hypothetical protein